MKKHVYYVVMPQRQCGSARIGLAGPARKNMEKQGGERNDQEGSNNT